MPSSLNEASLEALIESHLLDANGYAKGDPADYDRTLCLDVPHLMGFLEATQPEIVKKLGIGQEEASRTKFLSRLSAEIRKRGVVDVLRSGFGHQAVAKIRLYYPTPSAHNEQAGKNHAANRWVVTRQLRYSQDEQARSLDMVVFLNGLPIATFELKNSLTKQSTKDAIRQYQRDRPTTEPLFKFGVCLVHFAVDDQTVAFCTALADERSVFLPFNKGWKDGAGNPPNPDGLKTDYLWKEILTKEVFGRIIEKFAQIITEEDPKTKRKKRKQIFPRYHQLDVVTKLLSDAATNGPGKRYLVQHSAGSGKSNSITWLAHQLTELRGQVATDPVFDSIIVVTDRRVLDKQLRDNIAQFARVAGVVEAITQGSKQLKLALQNGKKIIITTIQKFPFVCDDIRSLPGNNFAIIIDEAHSSQGGQTAAKLNETLRDDDEEFYETDEDRLNKIIESRKFLDNASYFAFTATPKNKTLELFGVKQPDGTFGPFHPYTMRQAIDEGFILDVLQNYTTWSSYYKLLKKVEDDPEVDARKARKKLKKFVESHEHAIRMKAEIMVDHFHDEVIAKRKINGKAKAMVVTSGIERAIQYKLAIVAYLAERRSPYKALVAFTGEKKYQDEKYTEDSMNGFAGAKIPDEFEKEEYRFLIVAEKFQTGFDQPLLHTMYVDKELAGVQAVQTLSRLNRTIPGVKRDTFVLDFHNDAEPIRKSFEPYYKTTILSEETDPNKLHDLKAELDAAQVYGQEEVDTFVSKFLQDASRYDLDVILDACAACYKEELDEDGQIKFKGNAKAFVRTYNFLGGILPFKNLEWEKLATFLRFLVHKLPSPEDPDLAAGIMEAIDMDSYRVEKQATNDIILEGDETLEPVPVGGGGGRQEPDFDLLSNIIRSFNDQFGNIAWEDEDRLRKTMNELQQKIRGNESFQNAKSSKQNEQTIRIAHDDALKTAMLGLMKDHTQLYKLYANNKDFKRALADALFRLTMGDEVA
ncbi:type I restriction endonuclease subunit R [Haloferula sp. A504]|uniref:type I restriction endonuclease subunit R n=1 Tax=Haloferula sp. A504 TaxID=3373601 RepID=UPI0031C6EE19|nr:type I restriction endonuclease [Verrucomicrobiaceae bacterium E54]